MSTTKDRVALPPVNAQSTNLTCHFCIVGCGYHVYKWDADTEGGRAPHENALGVDFRKQVPPLADIMTPAMANTITDKDGRRYNIMIVPDKGCSVNQGLSSTRGGQLAKVMYTGDGVGKERLTQPARLTRRPVARHELGRRTGTLLRRHQEDSRHRRSERTRLRLLRPRRRRRRIREHLGHRQADVHGAARRRWCASTTVPRTTPSATPRARWASASSTTATKMRNWPTSSWRSAATRTRRRPTTSSRTGCPTCRAARSRRSRSGSPAKPPPRRKIIFVDPRRTPTIAIAEKVAGKDNVLHLDIEPGTDIALFNGFFTYVVEQGWHDKDFIAQYTRDFDVATSSQQALARRSEPHHRCSRRQAATGRRVGVQAEGIRSAHRARCTRTRRASSGATTTT